MVRTKRIPAITATIAPCLFCGPASAEGVLNSILAPIQQLWSGIPKNALAYEVRLSVSGDHGDLKGVLESASTLVAQSDQGAPSVSTLLAWAREEPSQLTAALYAQGYYSGRIEITVASQRANNMDTDIQIPRQGPIPVAITVEPGPLFHFGDVRISYTSGDTLVGVDADIAENAGLVPGAPAKSLAVFEAGNRLVASWKARGHAFAKVISRDVTADHAARTIDVAFVVSPGGPARFGSVEVKGADRFKAELLESRADIAEGEPYSPETLKSARKRLSKLDGLRSVRLVEGETSDTQGRIPVIIEVTERKARYVGANAAVSSVDGAEVGGYWGHRNFFGNGESLRFDATVSNHGGDPVNDMEYQAKISLSRPSIANPYTDYKTTVAVKHEKPDTYESDEATVSVGAIHQFTPWLTGELAVKNSWIGTEDVFGDREFFLLSLPVELVYDTRDHPLDASKGWRAALFAEPVADLLNSTAFVHTRAQLSGYTQINNSPRVVAAGRVGVGTIAGTDIENVPVTSRFLAGGGGSVRGYAFRSIGPEFAGESVGGLSVVEMSGELRIRVSDTVGIVPFVDAAFVTSGSFFGGESKTAVGVGLGLRYHTAIGPIRLDVATPLNKLAGDPAVVFYVGLGQAF